MLDFALPDERSFAELREPFSQLSATQNWTRTNQTTIFYCASSANLRLGAHRGRASDVEDTETAVALLRNLKVDFF